MSSPAAPPKVLAIVMADDVYIAHISRKFSIQGTYHALYGRTFPLTHPAFIAYLAFTNGHGEVTLTARLVDVDELRPPAFETAVALSFVDPLEVLEIGFFQVNVLLPQPGDYRLQLLFGTELLAERRLLVYHVSNGQP